jgi:PIN domain nuclease of toxin-antitoxin system
VKILLDTHVLLLWVTDSAQLSTEVRELFAPGSHELLWSAASTWELGIKMALGKLRLPEPLEDFIPRQIADQGLTGLPIYHDHVVRTASLPRIHRDPFDRMLIAQAFVERVPLATKDPQLDAYGIECIGA